MLMGASDLYIEEEPPVQCRKNAAFNFPVSKKKNK